MSVNCDCKYKINGYIKSFDDKYDFEMHWSWNPKEWARNAETIIGRMYNGRGKPFNIIIQGQKEIEESGELNILNGLF